MEYNASSSGINQKNIKKDNIEEALCLMQKAIFEAMSSHTRFDITAELPLSFKASVLRNLESGREIVRLISDNASVDLFRDTAGQPGDIGVSCDPDGDEVPVRTLNISFRDYEDVFTDRGIVWVCPGNPAIMHLCIKGQALKTPGMVTEIITEAEEAIKNKLLVHFPQIVTL